jgi:hypothetical protein
VTIKSKDKRTKVIKFDKNRQRLQKNQSTSETADEDRQIENQRWISTAVYAII